MAPLIQFDQAKASSRRFSGRLLNQDQVRRLETSTRPQDAGDLREYRPLARGQIEHAVGDDQIGPSGFDGQRLGLPLDERRRSSRSPASSPARAARSISGLMSTPITRPVLPT